MKKSLLMVVAMLTAGLAFGGDDKEKAGGDKPHHGPPPFEKLDANADGKVSAEEFKAMAPKDAPPEKIEAKFKKYDANGDGSVTKEEFDAARKHAKDHGKKSEKQ